MGKDVNPMQAYWNKQKKEAQQKQKKKLKEMKQNKPQLQKKEPRTEISNTKNEDQYKHFSNQKIQEIYEEKERRRQGIYQNTADFMKEKREKIGFKDSYTNDKLKSDKYINVPGYEPGFLTKQKANKNLQLMNERKEEAKLKEIKSRIKKDKENNKETILTEDEKQILQKFYGQKNKGPKNTAQPPPPVTQDGVVLPSTVKNMEQKHVAPWVKNNQNKNIYTAEQLEQKKKEQQIKLQQHLQRQQHQQQQQENDPFNQVLKDEDYNPVTQYQEQQQQFQRQFQQLPPPPQQQPQPPQQQQLQQQRDQNEVVIQEETEEDINKEKQQQRLENQQNQQQQVEHEQDVDDDEDQAHLDRIKYLEQQFQQDQLQNQEQEQQQNIDEQQQQIKKPASIQEQLQEQQKKIDEMKGPRSIMAMANLQQQKIILEDKQRQEAIKKDPKAKQGVIEVQSTVRKSQIDLTKNASVFLPPQLQKKLKNNEGQPKKIDIKPQQQTLQQEKEAHKNSYNPYSSTSVPQPETTFGIIQPASSSTRISSYSTTSASIPRPQFLADDELQQYKKQVHKEQDKIRADEVLTNQEYFNKIIDEIKSKAKEDN